MTLNLSGIWSGALTGPHIVIILFYLFLETYKIQKATKVKWGGKRDESPTK